MRRVNLRVSTSATPINQNRKFTNDIEKLENIDRRKESPKPRAKNKQTNEAPSIHSRKLTEVLVWEELQGVRNTSSNRAASCSRCAGEVRAASYRKLAALARRQHKYLNTNTTQILVPYFCGNSQGVAGELERSKGSEFIETSRDQDALNVYLFLELLD